MPAACRWLHVIHHKYNKGDQMSPFAGLAFHPLDGILQVRAGPVASGSGQRQCCHLAAPAREGRGGCKHWGLPC